MSKKKNAVVESSNGSVPSKGVVLGALEVAKLRKYIHTLEKFCMSVAENKPQDARDWDQARVVLLGYFNATLVPFSNDAKMIKIATEKGLG